MLSFPSFNRRSPPSSRRLSHRFRPSLEVLEDRSLPSTVVTSFDGLNQSDNAPTLIDPPDTNAAASASSTIEAVNEQIRARSRTTGNQLFQYSLSGFFGQQVANSNFTDPRVTYDDVNGFYVLTALEVPSPGQSAFSYLHYAVSTNSNPQSSSDFQISYKDAAIYTGTTVTQTADFDQLGWNVDAYFVTMNMFNTSGGYNHTRILTIPTTTPLTPLPFIDRTTSDGTYAPARMHGSVTGNEPMWYVLTGPIVTIQNVQHNTMVVYREDGTLSSQTFTSNSVVVNNFNLPANGQLLADQPNSAASLVINTGTNVVASPVTVQYKVGTVKHWRIYAANTIQRADNNATSVQWYQFDGTLAAAALAQQGIPATHVPGSAIFQPSIDVTADNNFYLTFMESGSASNDFLSVMEAAHRNGEPYGTLQDTIVVKAGTQAYTGQGTSPWRTGDFSSVQRDPANNTLTASAVWIANEYATSGTPPNWGTTVGQTAAADNQRIINNFYQDILGRAPTINDNVAYWQNLLDTGQTTSYVAGQFLLTQEYLHDVIIGYYSQYLNRSPQASELQSWTTYLQTSPNTFETFRASILYSQEYFNGKGGTNTTYVTGLYHDVLYRLPTQSETNYWVGQVGTLGRYAVAYDIVTSQEGYDRLLDNNDGVHPGYYLRYLYRLADTAGRNAFVTALMNGTITDQGVIQTMLGSLEYQNHVAIQLS